VCLTFVKIFIIWTSPLLYKKFKRFEDHDKCSRQIAQRIIWHDSCVFKCHARPNFLSALINFIEVDF
jgi:hypothetical protein